jgi:hypothetical protein
VANLAHADNTPSDPVERLRLFGAGPAQAADTWLDYRAVFGLDDSHIDALIGIACDRALLALAEDEAAAGTALPWAPMHAWRALGQLRAAAAVAPLLEVFRSTDDDWLERDLPRLLIMIGPAAIPHMETFLLLEDLEELCAITVVRALGHIGTQHPEARAACIAVAERMIGPLAGQIGSVVGFAIAVLTDLQAVESLGAIRDAFARDAVDIRIAGDLEDVEIALGVREQRETPRPRYHAPYFGVEDDAGWSDEEEGEPLQPVRSGPKIGRNAPCPCGSGKKYKKCCLDKA